MSYFSKVTTSIIVLVMLVFILSGVASAAESNGKMGTVTGRSVNFRNSPNMNSRIIRALKKGIRVKIISSSGAWYKVNYNGKKGWMRSSYISAHGMSKTKIKTTQNVSKGKKLVVFSKKFLGVPYKWGGESPGGFDCSGLMYYIYKKFDISLKRTSIAQSKQGIRVSKADLQLGDLIFFDTKDQNNKKVSHVGMYIGKDKFIHAANPRSEVRITNLSSRYYSKAYVTAKRIIK